MHKPKLGDVWFLLTTDVQYVLLKHKEHIRCVLWYGEKKKNVNVMFYCLFNR